MTFGARRRARRRFNPPILGRIVALVAVTLLAALGAMLAVTFLGPPPRPRPPLMPDVLLIGRGGRLTGYEWRVREQRLASVPRAVAGMRLDVRATADVAGQLRRSPSDVRLFIAVPPFRAHAGMRPFRPGAGMGPRMMFGGFAIAVRDPAGWRLVQVRPGISWRWYAVTLAMMTAIFILLLLPAWLVARRITRPLHRLARGAARARPELSAPLAVSGPPEVRQLAHAFNQMRARLTGHVTERTAMLLAIAHDLRTPMTRLSFRLEHLPDAIRARAQADLEEMRGMVTELLDFVRGEGAEVAMVRLDLSALVQTLADDLADMQRAVQFHTTGRAVIMGDAAALRRCIGNIAENAVRYGGVARLSLRTEQGAAVIDIDDDGPGVPADVLDRLCEPFFRGESSRNRETGGVGLGLAIARTLALRHGATLAFANRPEGGLRVTLRFALAA
ncbi:ATP-binding protein [Sphingobium aquiterrae]|uniref:ATP-binding protein n=1 Tax=Sphingobium aquiterrae TaxID=2038656 RepID=UPI00301654C5